MTYGIVQIVIRNILSACPIGSIGMIASRDRAMVRHTAPHIIILRRACRCSSVNSFANGIISIPNQAQKKKGIPTTKSRKGIMEVIIIVILNVNSGTPTEKFFPLPLPRELQTGSDRRPDCMLLQSALQGRFSFRQAL